MMKIGVTGGIGSGKTVVCNIFEHLGVPVYVADRRARELMESSEEIRSRLTELLGYSIYKEGHLDRPRLARAIFSDEGIRSRVNAIVHPVVFRDFETWASSYHDKPYVIQEAAILFESGADAFLDGVINVYAPVEVRIARVMQRDSITREAVRARMRSQMSERERQQRAGHTIVNDGRRMVVPQVVRIHERLVKKVEHLTGQ